jgi:hypothetical protein
MGQTTWAGALKLPTRLVQIQEAEFLQVSGLAGEPDYG